MKRAIRWYTAVICVVISAVFIGFSLLWVNDRFLAAARERLDDNLNTAIALTGEAPTDADAFADRLAGIYPSDVRITIIGADGRVRGDSTGQFETMQSHLDRKEVAGALRSGRGEDVRRSETTGERTIYVARKWGEDCVLRFSMPVAAAREFIGSMIPLFALVLVLIILLMVPVAGALQRRMLRPYDALADSIGAVIGGGKAGGRIESPVEELQPIAEKFNDLNERLGGYIEQLDRRTQEIRAITEKMREGLLLLDSDYNILLANARALEYLDIPGLGGQKNITYLYRHEAFCKALGRVRETGRREVLDLKNHEGRVLRTYLNAVPGGGYTVLISDVTELARLERMRSEFTSNVTHELKTPLTSISGFAELIANGLVTDADTIKQYSGRICEEARRLTALIDDVLQLSRLENGRLGEREPVDLRAVALEAVRLLDAQIKERGLSVQVTGQAHVDANRDSMYQMALNLIENAVKYNRMHGSVEVILTEDGNRSTFSVRDTGIGIPAEEQSRIFERFYRVDKSRNRKTGGTGLGLSIVKHIAEQYGGRVSVESGPEGSVFTVVFSRRVDE